MAMDESERRELLALEKQFWNAIKEKDTKTATALSDDPCFLVGPQGVGEIDRRTLASMMEEAPYELRRFSLEDMHVRTLGDDAAIVAYKVRESMVVDGEDVELEAFDSSVWTRRDGKWVCALHTESLAGDAFGRN